MAKKPIAKKNGSKTAISTKKEVIKKPIKKEVEYKKDPTSGKFTAGTGGHGRPLGSKTLSTELKEALDRREKKTGKTYRELMIEALLHKSIARGDVRAIELAFNRTEGGHQQNINGRYVNATVDASETQEQVAQALSFVEEWLRDTDEKTK